MSKNWEINEVPNLVKRAFRQVLKRMYALEELITYGAKLDRGEISVKLMIQELALSEEHEDRFIRPYDEDTVIKYCFGLLLGRDPSPDEIETWVDISLDEGIDNVIKGLMDSEEYMSRFGNDGMLEKQRIRSGDLVYLKAYNELHVCCEQVELVANRPIPLGWETFVIEKSNGEEGEIADGEYINLRAFNGKYVRFVNIIGSLLADNLDRTWSQQLKAFSFVHLAEKNSPQIPLDINLWEGGIPVLIFRAKYCGPQYNNIRVTITKGNPPEEYFNINISMYNQEYQEIYSNDHLNCDITNVESKVTDYDLFVECVILYKDFEEEISAANYSHLTGPKPDITLPNLIPLFPEGYGEIQVALENGSQCTDVTTFRIGRIVEGEYVGDSDLISLQSKEGYYVSTNKDNQHLYTKIILPKEIEEKEQYTISIQHLS